VFAVGFFLVALYSNYQGTYEAPPSVHIPFEEFTAPPAPPGDFVDAPLTEVRQGTLLVDAAHRNRFDSQELTAFTSRVTNRGYQVEFMGDFGSLGDSERRDLLESQLRRADSLVVILPQETYTPPEIAEVKKFVAKGGKLLLIADPTRRHDINPLAEAFGMNFQPDYLYNLVDYDLNYQEVFLREFQPDELTRGLEEIVLYSSGSVQSSGTGLAFTGGETRSTFSQLGDRFYPFARGEDRNVLALYDFTFMIPPHNSISDNDQLVSNLADYLTSSERDFHLTDFPSFFEGEVDIILSDSVAIDQGTVFMNLLADEQINSRFAVVEDRGQDTVFLGLYEDTAQVSQYLDALGVHIGSQIRTPFTPDADPDATAILLLHQSRDRDVLVILASSDQGLTDLTARISSGRFREQLVDDFVGVYKTQ
jgi:hypothetical protein